MKSVLIAVMLMVVSATSFGQKKLTIVVDGIEEVKGSLFVGIYNSGSTFLKETYRGAKVGVTGEVEELSLELPDGEYAISLFQDLNDNSKLDKGAFGIPTEKYGFSNNTEGFMGAPSFEKTKFTLSDDKVVRINIK
ncbi:MAG: DUF2141 domain-containing protein [Bacteroidales bacterium]|jgi:uncharacterized protein (DUF2141 family)|nr:DUF2141 domain-containing protein [Bacteroidales bacterium]